MKIIIQGCPVITALLIGEDGNIIAPETGRTELEAIGRLVIAHSDKFHLTEITGKHGPINLDQD